MKIVEIEMDKTRHLKFGMNTLIELEKKLDRPLTSNSSSYSLEDLRTILFVGLKWEDKTLNETKVGDLMDEAINKHGIEYMSGKLGEAFNGAFGGAGVTPVPNQ